MKKVLIPIADGVEDVETVTLIDLLRRANIHVTVASIYHDRLKITAARKTKIEADIMLQYVADEVFDMIVVPGGLPGAEYLRDSELLSNLLKKQNQQKKWYGAICASPVYVLQHHGLLEGKKATCFPGVRQDLNDDSMADKKVVVDKNCMTSQALGTAIDFGLEIIRQLTDKERSDDVKNAILAPE